MKKRAIVWMMLATLFSKLPVRQRTVGKIVFDLMDKIHYQAIDQIDRRIQESRLIERECVNR